MKLGKAENQEQLIHYTYDLINQKEWEHTLLMRLYTKVPDTNLCTLVQEKSKELTILKDSLKKLNKI